MFDSPYTEIITRLRKDYIPRSAEEFVGPARHFAQLVEKAVRLSKANGNSPLKFLFAGEPGVGKSALANYTKRLLGADPWTTTKLSGTSVKIEKVEELASQLYYKSLFGDWRIIHIEEADTIPQVAQVRFLNLLDNLPEGCAVLCTSNCELKQFERRFQSRFQVFEVEAPQPHEIETFLGNFIADRVSVHNIVTMAGGNVRQALFDTQTALQAAA